MKIEIPISEDIMERLQLLSEQMGSDVSSISSLVLKSGINMLLNHSCGTCGNQLTTKFVECSSCSMLFDCGYLFIQFENEWKGDRWLSDPTITCYSCLIINELETDRISMLNTTNEEDLWSLKEEFPRIIDQIIQESIRTVGDGETQTLEFPIKTEKVPPKSWNILNKKIDKFLIQMLNGNF